MQITYKGDYALKALLELTLCYGKGVVTIHELSKKYDIPAKFLEQVLLDLKRGGFVESRRGKVGGYLLAKEPAKISVGEVVRFIDGPVEPIGCVNQGYSGCSDIYKCAFRNIWCRVAEATSGIIDKVTFAGLADDITKQKEAVVYNI